MASTWNTTSTSSTNSSKYGLDEDDKKDVLVYQYRGGMKIQSQQHLCKTINQDPKLRVSKKKIPRGNSRIDVKTEDLYPDEERSLYEHYPNMKNSLANIGLPSVVYWKRLLFDQFKEIYIVSPINSPENTPNPSPESSQHVSPSSTFPRDETHPDAGSHPQDQ